MTEAYPCRTPTVSKETPKPMARRSLAAPLTPQRVMAVTRAAVERQEHLRGTEVLAVLPVPDRLSRRGAIPSRVLKGKLADPTAYAFVILPLVRRAAVRKTSALSVRSNPTLRAVTTEMLAANAVPGKSVKTAPVVAVEGVAPVVV